MIGNIGFPELILILVVLLLLFGPGRLPEIGRAFGRTIREFKEATRGRFGGGEGETEPSGMERTASSSTAVSAKPAGRPETAPSPPAGKEEEQKDGR